MAVTTTNLGVITAYGDAVAAGYTGTKAEWQTLMASYATVTEEANEAKDAAVSAKDTAVAKATEATTAANTANTAKDTATSKATEATTAANTATTKANEASASAQSIAQSASQIAQNTSDISELKEDLNELNNNFADMQSDGVAPSAEQILTDKGVTDSVPYHYRKTGGNGADRLYDRIVGGTVCFNQLVRNGNFADKSDWAPAVQVKSWEVENGKATIVCNSSTDNTYLGQSGYGFKSGHKYFYHCDYEKSSTSSTIYGLFVSNPSGIYRRFDVPQTKGTINLVYSSESDVTGAFRTGMRDSAPTGEWTYTISNIMVIDLTAMFGSTIADYIYNLEQTTAGAGVAFFKALFPNDYYPYDAGTLKSVEGLSAHKMVGFNQWDEEWEQGYISNTGELQNNGYYFRSKNYIPIFPETTYFYKCPADYSDYARFTFYDADKRFLSYVGTSSYIDWTFTTPANAHYMKFTTGEKLNKSGVSYRGDICINISDPTRNGQYEPYESHSYPLDSTLTLRGLFKLDANNNLYADGDTYDADGTVTRKYGIVDLGTLDWKASSTANCFYATAPLYKMVNNMNYICERYKADGFESNSHGYYGEDGTIRYNYESRQTACEFYVHDSSYTDAATFKTAMSGVMLVYELATPTTEEADPYQHLQQCDPSGTEEFVSTGIVPVGHETRYPENLRAKIEQLPWNFANLIAPTESTYTATRNYTTGALFIVDNVLYKATSNIANGGTITPNTNCTATTLAEIISALA